MKAAEGIDLRAIHIGPFVMEMSEGLVDFSDEGRFDESKNCVESVVLAIMVPESGPVC